MSDLIIRNETENDCRTVEKITRDAFWDVNFPGCDEHYLAHILRGHEDFIRELDFVAELDGQVIGNIMYTKAALIDENGAEKDIITFGPVSITPEFQRMGYGKKLIEYSLEKAAEMGHEAVVIFGHPSNYISMGFKSCKKYNVSVSGGAYPCAMLVKELKQDALSGKNGSTVKVPHIILTKRTRRNSTSSLRSARKGIAEVRKNFIFTVIRS